jgi:hypothetical protein
VVILKFSFHLLGEITKKTCNGNVMILGIMTIRTAVGSENN